MVSKAPHLLLEAASGLPPGSVSVELFGEPVDYHGDSSYRERLAPLLSQPHVQVRGRIAHDDVARVLSNLDVLVVPSIWPENSPLVIREAFLAGVPVVASRIGGIPETVTDGVNGLLFTPGDAADLRRQRCSAWFRTRHCSKRSGRAFRLCAPSKTTWPPCARRTRLLRTRGPGSAGWLRWS